jgi:hypothetical protein
MVVSHLGGRAMPPRTSKHGGLGQKRRGRQQISTGGGHENPGGRENKKYWLWNVMIRVSGAEEGGPGPYT